MIYRITLVVFLLLCSRVLFADAMTFPKIDDAVFIPLSEDEIPLLTRERLKEVSAANLRTASGISSYIQLVTGETVKPPYLVIAFTKQDHIDNIASLNKWLLQNIDKSNNARMVSQSQKDPVRIMISDIVIMGRDGSCDARPVTETLYVGEVHKFDVSCELDSKAQGVLQSSFVLSYASNYSFRTIARQLPSIDIFASEPSDFFHTFETDVATKVKVTYKPL